MSWNPNSPRKVYWSKKYKKITRNDGLRLYASVQQAVEKSGLTPTHVLIVEQGPNVQSRIVLLDLKNNKIYWPRPKQSKVYDIEWEIQGNTLKIKNYPDLVFKYLGSTVDINSLDGGRKLRFT